MHIVLFNFYNLVCDRITSSQEKKNANKHQYYLSGKGELMYKMKIIWEKNHYNKYSSGNCHALVKSKCFQTTQICGHNQGRAKSIIF